MTRISEWGPIIWTFFHTIVQSINENYFTQIYKSLFNYIKSICNFLPCPQCSKHAKEYLKNISYSKIDTKEKFIQMLFHFHNEVNKNNNKKLFLIEDIHIYEKKSLIDSYNNFIKIFLKKGNLQQINESFKRKIIIQNLMQWLNSNKKCFTANNSI